MIKRLCAMFAMATILVMLVSCVYAAEFSAVITNTDGKNKSKEIGKLYVNGKKVRCEMKTPQGNMIQILSNKKIWLINPAVKEYIEIPAQGTSVGLYMTSKDAKSPKGVKAIGVDTYDGYICDKYSLAAKQEKVGKITTTIWVSKKLDAVIKIELVSSKSKTIINFKVRNGKQKSSLFKLPEGYTKREAQRQRPMGR